MVNKPYEAHGFKLDSDFMPVSVAGGGKGDLYCEFNDFTILTEVTIFEPLIDISDWTFKDLYTRVMSLYIYFLWQRYGNKKSDSPCYLNNESNTNTLC